MRTSRNDLRKAVARLAAGTGFRQTGCFVQSPDSARIKSGGRPAINEIDSAMRNLASVGHHDANLGIGVLATDFLFLCRKYRAYRRVANAIRSWPLTPSIAILRAIRIVWAYTDPPLWLLKALRTSVCSSGTTELLTEIQTAIRWAEGKRKSRVVWVFGNCRKPPVAGHSKGRNSRS